MTQTKWSIQLVDNWVLESNKNYYLCSNPKGYGSLILSEYTKDTTITNKDIIDLEEFNNDDILHLKEVKCGDFNGLYIAYTDEENNFWRKWWLKNKRLLLFVSYNCDFKNKSYEMDLVDKMLSSLIFLKS
jgi:hypothetical protein